MPLPKIRISFNAFLREKNNLLANILVKYISKAVNQIKYNFFSKQKKRFIYQNKTLFVFYYPEVMKNQTDN